MSFEIDTVFTEGRHTGEYLMSEANRSRSRDAVTFASGNGMVIPGQVMGQQKIGAPAAPVAGGANKGNGAIGAVALGPSGKVGTYTIEFSGANAYEVIDPRGQVLPAGAAPNSWGDDPSGPEISFTFAAGATAMQAGDSFTVAIAAGSGKFVPCKGTATDGSQYASAISYSYADTTSGDVSATVTARDAEVFGLRLTWDASISSSPTALAAALAQLAAKGIVAR